VNHPTFGWLGFGGDVKQAGKTVRIVPKDSARTRLFIAPAGLWLTLDAGHFESADYDPATRRVRVQLAPADRFTPKAYLNIATTVAEAPAYGPTAVGDVIRGAHAITLSGSTTTIELTPMVSAKKPPN
jgi:hypothetical protein